LLETLTREAQNLLTHKRVVITELQNSLMRTRMVPFQRHVQRLTRLVRQAANDTGKRAELVVQGAAGRTLPPDVGAHGRHRVEHMLRYAVVHGIEKPGTPLRRGQPDVAEFPSTDRDGAEVVIVLADDGQRHQRETDPREKRCRSGLVDRYRETHRRRGHAHHWNPASARRDTHAGRPAGAWVWTRGHGVKKLGGGGHRIDRR